MSLKTLEPLVVGSGRGADTTCKALAKLNESLPVTLKVIDPEPSKSLRLAESYQDKLPMITPIQERLERFPVSAGHPLILNVDQPQTLAHGVQLTQPSLILGYALLSFPLHPILGMRFFVRPKGDEQTRQDLQVFFSVLAEIVALLGSAHVIGRRAPIANSYREQPIRDYFETDTLNVLRKHAAGFEPQAYPITVTPDGKEERPLIILQRKQGVWGETAAEILAEASPKMPNMPTNARLMIAEVGEKAIRLHPGFKNGAAEMRLECFEDPPKRPPLRPLPRLQERNESNPRNPSLFTD